MKAFSRTIWAAALLLAALPAQAQYPSRNINLLVGFPPGGNIDIVARQAQPFLEKYLGGKIAVINKPGAAGALANSELASAQPDGYTLGVLSAPGVFTILFGGNLTYTADSFDYVGSFSDEPYSLFVHPESKYQTLKGMVDHLKANPGSVTISGSGSGGAVHLGVLAFARAAGVKINYIPVQGVPQMLASVQGRHTDGGLSTVSTTGPLMQEGTVKVLGLMAEERYSKMPTVPTMKENGYNAIWGSLRGIAGPKGLPADVKARLADAIQKTHKDPEFLAAAEKSGMILRNLNSEQYRKESVQMYEDLAAMWKEAPWR